MTRAAFKRAGGAASPGRRLRVTLDFAAIDDRARLPWRFLARHMAVDDLGAA